jgi:hypothetical protein
MGARTILMTASVIALLARAPLALPAQVELDRIVSRVDGRIVTQSDIRQARALKLVDETASDEATQRALETRLLILHELDRAAPLPPSSPSGRPVWVGQARCRDCWARAA